MLKESAREKDIYIYIYIITKAKKRMKETKINK